MANLSTSFGAAADAYEAGRPDYPLEAVVWLLEPAREPGRALRVADVGAGTGKLTRVVVEAGAEAVAIDPDPDMLRTLRAHVHGVPTYSGTAERMPLPDASVDAVVLGQAWHWVDPDTAAVEVARVVRPGGVLGLIWNIRDDEDPWVRRLTAVMHGSHAEEMLAGDGVRIGSPFCAIESRTWHWTRAMTRDSLRDMAASRSYVITAPHDERVEILARVDDLFTQARRPDADVVEVPYRTAAFRSIRPK